MQRGELPHLSYYLFIWRARKCLYENEEHFLEGPDGVGGPDDL